MKRECPNSSCKTKATALKSGRYFRKSDSKWIQRYSCKLCRKHFSSATFSENFGQNKRRVNPQVLRLYCSGVSQRRISRILKINLKTVARKLHFLNIWVQNRQLEPHLNLHEIQFDEMESWIHSKLKPVSIIIAVEKDTRFILDIDVRNMPAKGLIRDNSIKKYGKIVDERPLGMKRMFTGLQERLPQNILIESDENPRYPRYVRQFFPKAKYKRYKGRRGCVVGQGELKAGGKDPLFSLNHTCAMIRANVNRLFRRTWCTSKDIKCLQMHLNLYRYYHNHYLI
jgi:transposase-like protein